jgi:hypothetical protein
LIVLRCGKSLSSGYGSLRESAKVFCENGLFELMPRIWTPSASNFAWSAFLADRLAAQTGEKSAP